MKKFLFFILIVLCSANALYAGFFCRSGTFTINNMVATPTLMQSTGITVPFGAYMNQFPVLYGKGANISSGHTKMLFQGFCASNEIGLGVLEFTELVGPYVSDGGDIPLTCWCQMILPYVSKVVYRASYSESTGAGVESCVAQCTNACVGWFNASENPGLRNRLAVPSEIIYQ